MKIWMIILSILLGLSLMAQDVPLVKSLSETVECSSSLNIVKFQLSKTETNIDSSVSRLPFKVVFGRKIDYKAKPRKNGLSFDWDVGRYDSLNVFRPYLPFAVSPVNPIPFKDKGIALLPETALPVENSKLGYDTSGVVRAIKHLEVDSTVAYSVDTLTPPNVGFFFEKDNPNVHDPSVPNWFYYWSQSPKIQNLLTIPGITLYNLDSCRYNSSPTPVTLNIVYDAIGLPYNPSGSTTYGYNSFAVGSMDVEPLFQGINDPSNCIGMAAVPERIIIGYNHSNKINIGAGCGYKKGMDTCNPLLGNHEGIHTLYTTIVHEVEHAIIECDIWEFTHSSDTTVFAGYSSLWDLDNDGYKDLWEAKSMEGMMFMFNPNLATGGGNDRYNSSYTSSSFCAGTESAGTMFEETRCRAKEHLATPSIINADDWSFDSTNGVQGKQWKN